MSAITELRKKAEAKFPGYPVDFEDGSRIILKSSANFSESEREDFDARVSEVRALENNEDAKTSDLHRLFVEALASVSDNHEKAQTELAKESVALLTVVFEEYGKHVQEQESEGAPKSAGTQGPARTRRGPAKR